jgi:hypothetical protein
MLSSMYTDIALVANAMIGKHPRYALIARQLSLAISPELQTSARDADGVQSASERVARDSTQRAAALFCDETWTRHVFTLISARTLAGVLPASPPERPLSTTVRNFAEPLLMAAFNAGGVCDHAQLAVVIEDSWAQLAVNSAAGYCLGCASNKHALSCPAHMCRACCRAQGTQCPHHR